MKTAGEFMIEIFDVVGPIINQMAEAGGRDVDFVICMGLPESGETGSATNMEDIMGQMSLCVTVAEALKNRQAERN